MRTHQDVVDRQWSGMQVCESSRMHLLESQLSRVRWSQDGVAQGLTSMTCGPSQTQMYERGDA